MRTDFNADFLATTEGARANEILRSCVHCGFCNATCPTYQLTGDELDGPRGRIYLIRELLENDSNVERATTHLDRCLTCRACETTCPSGVAYGELAEIARNQLGPQRSGIAGMLRRGLSWMVPNATRLRALSRLGRGFRWALPKRLARQIPRQVGKALPANEQVSQPYVVLLNGCAQQVLTAQTNQHLQTLLQQHDIGVAVVADEGCCGSLDLHAGDVDQALAYVRHNVDALAPLVADAEALLSSASGCGVTVKDYGRLLRDDPDYAERARMLSDKTLDVAEYLHQQQLPLGRASEVVRVAWHPPCTLQHGQQVTGVVEQLLAAAGYELVQVQDQHLCCGSAGTYAVMQPQLSEQLLRNKLAALQAHQPELIASANVGCQSHLANGTELPVVHWIELLK